MTDNARSHRISASDLRREVLDNGLRSDVKVNHRQLIGNVLARYASNFLVCRELIQNADDAEATWFHFEISCKHNKMQTKTWHNSTITEIRAVNNGRKFTEDDWKRVASIADGNKNVDAIGQFGVGFFTVFSYSAEPIIVSGKECMVFYWKDDSLKVVHHRRSANDQPNLTSIILKMQDEFILDTENTLAEQNTKLNPSTVRNDSNTSAPETKIMPTINLYQLKAYFAKVLSFTKHIKELVIEINGSTVFQVNKRKKMIPPTKETSMFKIDSIYKMLHLHSFVQSDQMFSIGNGPSVTLTHIEVQAELSINDEFHNQIRRIIKKKLPNTVQIQLLFAPNSIITGLNSSNIDDLNVQILNSLIPLKYDENKIVRTGQIFVGLETYQTIGLGMHICSQFIPTVERENLDLQNVYLARWNKELLVSTGQIARFVYDQTMCCNVQDNDTLSNILHRYSFQKSVPNNEIGDAIVHGFFASKEDILVPVKQSALPSQFFYLPSSKAFLTDSKDIHSFLTLPLIPLKFSHSGLFIALKERGLLQEVTPDRVQQTVSADVLQANGFIALLHWLCTSNVDKNRQFIYNILLYIRFYDDEHAQTITLENIKYYNRGSVSSNLDLPRNVLPTRITAYISEDDLKEKLSLIEFTRDDLLIFYISNIEQYLKKKNLVVHIFNFISKHWTEIKSFYNILNSRLSNIECIPTTQGMKMPKQSYIPSKTSSSDVAIIELNVVQSINKDDKLDSDDRVLRDFLKLIGCRTINVQSYLKNLDTCSDSSLSSSESLKLFVQQLLSEEQNITSEEINEIAATPWLPGTTLQPTSGTNGRYCANELHFRWVAIELQWPTLLIIDWQDIPPNSKAYAFLKYIGVREFPVLDKLIDWIIEVHDNQQHTQQADKYQISSALKFLAEKLEANYPELWKTRTNTRGFLPAYWPRYVPSHGVIHDGSPVMLMPVKDIFTNASPLCASPLRQVIELFKNHLDLSHLGVEDDPTLAIAFDILIDRKNQVLTSLEWTSSVFAYMKNLDGLNNELKERIATQGFIPVQGTDTPMQPKHVFIRSNLSATAETRGVNPADTRGLIDYVDFGPDANSFLLDIGVCHEPSASIFAELILNRHASFLPDLKRQLSNKGRVYIQCLQWFEATIRKEAVQFDDRLQERLENEKWCLARSYSDTNTNELIPEWKAPKEIYCIDDHNVASKYQPLCPPDGLQGLYQDFGTKWLSACINETFEHTGEPEITDRGNQLCDLIVSRLGILFVDRRGKRLNLNEDSYNLLRTNLTVYEVDDVKCQWIFRDEPVTSSDTHSCLIEKKDNIAALYIQKKQTEIQYIDVASAIARFVVNLADDNTIMSIFVKLTFTLDELKRFGLPAEQLITCQQHQRNVLPRGTSNSDINSEFSRLETYINSNRAVSKYHECNPTTRHTVVHDIIKKIKPYTQPVLNRKKTEHGDLCLKPPNTNMKRCPEKFSNISIYTEEGIALSGSTRDRAKQLATIVRGLATQVYNIPEDAMNLYRDKDKASLSQIAFNYCDAIFISIDYFEGKFNKEWSLPADHRSASIPTIHHIINFYFIVTSHLLVHNRHIGHHSDFFDCFEKMVNSYLPIKDIFLKRI